MRSLLVAAVFALAAPAAAQDAEAARAFFDEFVKRENAFDPAIGELYADDARIIALRDGSERLELTATQFRALLPRAMPMAKQRGDRNQFESVRIEPHGAGFRVTATRIGSGKCTRDPNFHLDLALVGESWRIVEDYSETVSLSQCEPSPKLAAALRSVRDAIAPHLPRDLDADTRLEAVDLVGSALIYRLRLPTVDGADIDLKRLDAELKKSTLQDICGRTDMKGLVEAGATVRYRFSDAKDVLVTQTDISPGVCALLAPPAAP